MKACGRSDREPEDKGGRIAEIYEAMLGRAPDRMIGEYEAAAISLPSGTIEKSRHDSPPAPDGFDAREWRKAIRFAPAGLMRLDADDIVAVFGAEDYTVLPSQFGLAKLVGEGKLSVGDRNRYRVVQPIGRFPARLTGAHSVTFILPAGMAEPAGNPGHSHIIREGTANDGLKTSPDRR